jgi:hypothetical protein
MIHKKSKKRNFKKSYRRISKLKKYIGGENCSQYTDQAICLSHRPECLWKLFPPKCIDNIQYIKDISQPQTKESEIKKHTTQTTQQVQSLPISTTKTSSIVFGKRQPVTSYVPIPLSILKTPQSARVLEPPTVKSLQPLSQKINILDNLQLVEPFMSSGGNWPILTDVINVPGDGDCLFHALRAGLRSLGLYQGSTRELRTSIVNELRKLLKNGDDLSPLFYSAELGRRSAQDNLTFGEYYESQHATDIKKIPLTTQVKSHLDQMAANMWGTEIEIWMAARVFNVNIDVYTLPRDPRTKQPLATGKIMHEGKSQFIPLQPLNTNENPALPTIRLFNASGASPIGIHYQVLPSSISIDQYLLQNK